MIKAVKKSGLYIVLLFWCSPLAAQQNRHIIDSLKQAFTHAKHDTTKVLLLNELINAVPGNEIEPYNQQLLTIVSSHLNQSDGAVLKKFYTQFYAIGLNNLAFICEEKGATDTALQLYRKSLELNRSIGNKAEISAVLGNIGYVFKSKGNLDTALDYYQQAMDIAVTIGDKRKEANMLNNIGIILSIKGNLLKGQEYYFRALRIAEQNHYVSLHLTCLNSIGGIYSRIGQIDSSLIFYKRALAISEKEHQANINASLLNNIGWIYRDLKQYDTALKYHTKALRIAEKIENKTLTAQSLNGIGTAYYELGLTDTALFYLRKCIVLTEQLGDKLMLSNPYVNMGLVYQKKGLTNKALPCFKKGMELAQQSGSVKSIMIASNSLYQIYKEQGNIQEALRMHEIFKQMTDSIQNDNIRKTTIRMQYQYEYKKKAAADSIRTAQENRINAVKLSQERTQRAALVIILGLVIVAAFFFIRQQRLNEKLKVARLRNHIAGDLHDDVGSTMSTISILSEVAKNNLHEQEKVTTLLDNIGSNSRQLLETLDDIVWSVNPRNDSFAQMIPRMKQLAVELLGNKGISLQFNLPEHPEKIALSMEQRRNLYLVYKEALHNIAKYATASNVAIVVQHQGKKLSMMIRDDGRGFDPATVKKGNGLSNMATRAAAMKGHYSLTSKAGEGTTITLDIPIK